MRRFTGSMGLLTAGLWAGLALGAGAAESQQPAPSSPPPASAPAQSPWWESNRGQISDAALAKAVGFNRSRLALLDAIARDNPGYAERCRLAREAWIRAFGTAGDAIEAELSARGVKQKAVLERTLAEMAARQAGLKGPSEADLPAKFGPLFDPQAQTSEQAGLLLAFSAPVAEHPELEAAQGWVRAELVDVAGDDKLALRCQVPLSWRDTRAGKQHAQFRSFLSGGGVGPAQMMFSARSRGERAGAWSQTQAQDAADKFEPPTPSVVVLERSVLQLPDGSFAATQLYRADTPAAAPGDKAVWSLNRLARFPRGSVLITVTGAVVVTGRDGQAGPDDQAMQGLMKRFEPALEAMLVSIETIDRPIAPPSEPPPGGPAGK